jgi:hypothetical protein
MTMPRIGLAAVAFTFALAVAPAPTRSATPDPALFAFPGSSAGPATAVTAGAALADRWLGDEPFDNPAFSARRGLELSPALFHPSRQDLRAANRNYAETSVYLDGAGGWIALPLGRATLFAYGSQPVLRQDDNAFTRGVLPVDPVNPPARLETQSEARERRVGGGLSWGDSGLRIGAAGEWTQRDDRYEVSETSGSPLAGRRSISFSGDAVGLQAGVRLARGLSGRHPLTAGLGVRMLPAIPLSARDIFDPVLPGPTDTTEFSAERGSSWEGGVSARYGVSEAFALTAGAGGHGAQAWNGLGATAGAGSMWSIAGAYHDPEEPWVVRFGFGQERQNGAPEPRADLLGLGLGWNSEGTRVEVGVLRRAIRRDGSPISYDDRVVASIGVTF